MKLFFAMFFLASIAGCTAPEPQPPVQKPAPVAETQTMQAFSSQGAEARMNAIRTNAGLSAVRQSARLDRVAQGHARDMAQNDFFSHTGSNGTSIGQRARRGGYDWCLVAENISRGIRTPEAAIRSWEKSRSHFRNMIRPGVREFGLARAGTYWVMVLGATSC